MTCTLPELVNGTVIDAVPDEWMTANAFVFVNFSGPSSDLAGWRIVMTNGNLHTSWSLSLEVICL